jgi:DNA-binding PadR family transcriptional regulator
MAKRRVIGPEQAAILRLFVDPEDCEHHARRLFGLEIMRLTKLPSGTVYPALDRLRRRGFLASEQEEYTGQAGRRRVYYTLDDVDGARAALAERANRDRVAERTAQQRRPLLSPAGSARPA